MTSAELRISYPEELPVSARREELLRVLAAHQVVIVAGETGSGKTTQLPKMLLELGCERIGHTQPRRIAARSVAERIAEELGVELGEAVGYQVRFTDRSSAATRLKVMTDGVLLAEIARDRDLRRYDAIVIDEAHERSLTIDFLLGYLKRLLPSRPDLRVVVTSATIDPESFARYFADAAGVPAPIVEVSGRTFPVEVRYRPLVPEDDTAEDDTAETRDAEDDGEAPAPGDDTDALLAALDELAGEEPGDVLVFLSGENEIRGAEEAVRGRYGQGRDGRGTEVLPLYGRLSAEDQHRVFARRAPGIARRIVLATNVAETSLTVPGIRYVIDGGTARISRYSTRAKVQRLPIEPISQASANQRAGRAGRTSPGIAIRLYSEADYLRRPEYTDPEIVRTNLAAVILQLLALGLGDLEAFPFLQPPDARGIRDGLDLLVELGAVAVEGDTRRITAIGRELARLPVDPRFGRMLVEARRTGVADAVVPIVAGLTIQDPRERPREKREQADAAHARFADPTSDFLALLGLWTYLQHEQDARSSSAFRRMCRADYLNYLRVREWQDLVRQLHRALRTRSSGQETERPAAEPDAVHRALLAGLLSRIGIRDERTVGTKERRRATEYLAARAQRFVVFPGSALARRPPRAVMAAELVETSRLFGRTVAAIDPEWAERLGGDLVKRSYGEPRWLARQGSAVVDERVTLFGVPLVEARRIRLARIDPDGARELFLRHAMVAGEWNPETRGSGLLGFVERNARVRRELREVEERTRRRDLLFDDEAVFRFYERRVPAEVTDTRSFERWWRRERQATPDLLTLTAADLDAAEAVDEDLYPSEWHSDDQRLRLAYRFEPGADDDGVTVDVPLALLPRVDDAGLDWLVPGMRQELVAALLRTLPKSIRRQVVPVGDWARRLVADLPEHPDGPLTERLADAIRATAHTVVTPDDFELERLPAHLRPTFAAVDERGRRLGRDKDLDALRARFADHAHASVVRAAAPEVALDPALTRSGLTTFDLDALPAVLERRVGGSTVRAYPALRDDGTTVSVTLLPTAAEAERTHLAGIRRLLVLGTPSPASYVQEHLTASEKLSLATSPYPSTAALLTDAVGAAIDAVAGDRAPRTRAEFAALREGVSAGLVERVFRIVADAAATLAAARDADRVIASASSLAFLSPLADTRAQLEALVHPGFIARAGAERLQRMPVYARGIVHRIERLAENPGRDRAWQSQVEQALALYRDAGGTLPLSPDAPPRLVAARWMLEELRLSLFAQPLRASGPVSVQRIRAALL
ncbi:MAG: ATP-dependent RNA helicase HrpA [Micrococcales bacterium]|nr:ATP-dependent RNA helicase HrpA [Micrococcales bacterium]